MSDGKTLIMMSVQETVLGQVTNISIDGIDFSNWVQTFMYEKTEQGMMARVTFVTTDSSITTFGVLHFEKLEELNFIEKVDHDRGDGAWGARITNVTIYGPAHLSWSGEDGGD